MSEPKTKLTVPQVKTDTETEAVIKRDLKEGKERKEKVEEENKREPSEAVIRLQSILLSDLFRLLNRQSRSTKTKDETIIR